MYDYIIDAFTRDGNNTNLEVDNLNVGCITSKNNNFDLDSNGNLTVNSITTNSITGQALANLLYPIGSIYMSVDSTSPATLFGGTWQRFANGRVLVGIDENQTEFNTVNKTGGSKNMQKHTHTQKSCTNPGDHSHNTWNYFTFHHSSGGVTTSCTGEPSDGRGNPTQGAGGHTHTITLNETGTGTSGNLQPYVCVYIWQRVS